MLAIRLPEGIESRLNELASKTGRTKTFYVREAILRHLDDLEDYYLAEDRMDRYDATKAIPLETVKARYGVED